MNIKNIMWIAAIGLTVASCGNSTPPESTRAERKHILEGNDLYGKGDFQGAIGSYNAALEEREGSVEARYNLGVSQIRRSQTLETDSLKQAFMQTALGHTREVTRHGADKPLVASRANYNLGNVSFDGEDYAAAIEQYKQALRLNPSDEAARRNLRIAQLKKQQQDDKNDDNNQNQDHQNQQNQDQQDQQQNRDQQQEDQQDRQQPPQQDEQEINPQTSEQILKAMENKENQTRARVMRGQNGQEAAGSARHRKNW
ncbi:MAG: tetratricopeptide repeat protein [Muribaculaceae bacterium]|nr:tetratricopeptide repeat protein [Muribaculaceae bacterium]